MDTLPLEKFARWEVESDHAPKLSRMLPLSMKEDAVFNAD